METILFFQQLQIFSIREQQRSIESDTENDATLNSEKHVQLLLFSKNMTEAAGTDLTGDMLKQGREREQQHICRVTCCPI